MLRHLPQSIAADKVSASARRNGFTLIELLTVLAVVAILATILIPAIAKSRETAMLATCTSRLRELGLAFQLYTQDNNNFLPKPENAPQSRWPIHIAPYIGDYEVHYEEGRVWGLKSGSRNIYEDPSVRDPSYPYDRNNSGRGVFGYNATLENRIVDLKELSSPGSLPVLASSQGDVGGLRLAKEGPSPIAKRFGYSGSTTPLGPAPNYGGRAVFLFADWRVESRDICRSDQWPWDDPQAFYPN